MDEDFELNSMPFSRIFKKYSYAIQVYYFYDFYGFSKDGRRLTLVQCFENFSANGKNFSNYLKSMKY